MKMSTATRPEASVIRAEALNLPGAASAHRGVTLGTIRMASAVCPCTTDGTVSYLRWARTLFAWMNLPLTNSCVAPATGNWIYWYSFNYGGIHVVQMSTEHDFTRGSEQFEWLARDLASVDRSVTPWIILTAHRMMVTIFAAWSLALLR